VRQLLRIEQSGAFVGLVGGGVADDDGDPEVDPFYEDDDDEEEDYDGSSSRRPGGSNNAPLLSRRQQRAVKDLVAGATRWQRRLDFVLSQLLTPPKRPARLEREQQWQGRQKQAADDGNTTSATKRPAAGDVSALEPAMRAVLRLAMFELTERRLPAHALGEYVSLARRVCTTGGDRDRAAAFCNAVLRNAARQWEAGELPLPERALAAELQAARDASSSSTSNSRREAVRALAAVHSHPAWMVGRWLREWGPAEAVALLRRNNERPAHCLRASRPGGAPDLLRALEREAEAAGREEEEEEEDLEEEAVVAGRRNAATPPPASSSAAAVRAAAALSAAAAAAIAPSSSSPTPPPPPPKAATATAAPAKKQPPPPTTPAPTAAAATLSRLLPDDFVRLPAEGGLLQIALRSGLVASGLCTVQDEATGLVVKLALAPRAGEAILDACAAPGGKALYASALMAAAEEEEGAGDAHGGGMVVATDVSAPRLRALAGTARRLASAGPGAAAAVRPLVVGPACDLRDYERARKDWGGEGGGGQAPSPLPALFDAVLLDAPCSGTGVLSKRADLRWRRTPEQLERQLLPLQDALLDAAARLVKPGGRLVFATCSVEKDENDRRVAAFLERHGGNGGEWAVEALGEGEIFDGPYLRLLPHVHGTDGAFACRLRKK
jgi:16S rRNA C967 or C1407 C5-methylase (RsmB/RsmF family)